MSDDRHTVEQAVARALADGGFLTELHKLPARLRSEFRALYGVGLARQQAERAADPNRRWMSS